MKRILWLSLIAAGFWATATAAGPGRSRPFSARGQAPQAAPQAAPLPAVPEYHRTSCSGWAAAASESRAGERPLVWVLDGAGDLKGCSNALGSVNVPAGEPVELAVFPWSHGYRKLLKDQIDTNHARVQGAKLAEAIRAKRAEEPGRRTVVVGHSAGCAVALAACDVLPPDSVDRVRLLAPSVSTEYDIRPTLRAAKEGVDVFCSTKDWVALGFVMRVVGTTDTRSGSAAGRWGFQPKGPATLAADETVRLRQHFWSQDVAWTGHTGGHHGMHAPEFVKTFLMPLLTGK